MKFKDWIKLGLIVLGLTAFSLPKKSLADEIQRPKITLQARLNKVDDEIKRTTEEYMGERGEVYQVFYNNVSDPLAWTPELNLKIQGEKVGFSGSFKYTKGITSLYSYDFPFRGTEECNYIGYESNFGTMIKLNPKLSIGADILVDGTKADLILRKYFCFFSPIGPILVIGEVGDVQKLSNNKIRLITEFKDQNNLKAWLSLSQIIEKDTSTMPFINIPIDETNTLYFLGIGGEISEEKDIGHGFSLVPSFGFGFDQAIYTKQEINEPWSEEEIPYHHKFFMNYSIEIRKQIGNFALTTDCSLGIGSSFSPESHLISDTKGHLGFAVSYEF